MAEMEGWQQEVIKFMAVINNQVERINTDLYDGRGPGLLEEFRGFMAEQRGVAEERKRQDKRNSRRWVVSVSIATIFTTLFALLTLLIYFHATETDKKGMITLPKLTFPTHFDQVYAREKR